ncbi:PAS domain-containing protein [Massilia sp. RP-1-19]|uniref:histidine kinase n=1 Tax=Massilia polaris TaxID=2728846 RepID=A0A848HIU0_9BURK|nr:ATP-binding protein [Massilia polaris]NML60967.1 PAS domain-containing protein [Massilia polaris]
MENAQRPSFNFLSHGGEMGAQMRARDWNDSLLGPTEAWPPLLKSIVRVMLSSSHPMFLWWGPDLVQFYNDAYSRTMGPERHPGALGQPGRECWEEIWPIIGPQIEFVMDGKGATWNEDQLVPVTRNGKREEVWWTYGYSPVEDNDGVHGVLVVCNDVTAQHNAKAELEQVNHALTEQIAQREQAQHLEARQAAQLIEAEQALDRQHASEGERLRALFQQAPGFMCILRGPDLVYEFANAAYARFIGDRELIGKTVREALPEVAGQGFYELLDGVYQSGKPFAASDVTLLLHKTAGAPMTPVYCDFVYQPIFTGAEVSGIFVEGFDVTERVLAKQALECSELRLREGMKVARMVVWDWILATNEVIFSENAPELFGANWTNMHQVWGAVVPEDMKRLDQARRGALARSGTYGDIIRLVRPDSGELVWLQVYGTVVADAGGVPRWIRGVSIDVTARKRAEESLREASRHKDEFLAMLSHELRNPLAPIRAAAHLLGMAPDNVARVRQSSVIIERQVNHMNSLINDLLDVSRVNTGLVVLEKDILDLHQVVLESLEQTLPLIQERGHRITVQAPEEGEVVVWGDRKRLVQVLTNLLHNASKYTPPGGCIALDVVVHAGALEIHVRDNGIGIGADLLPHVFELFTQHKRSPDRSQGGLGLGLALVRSLVTLHDGHVTVVSDGKDAGSTFSVYLPRHLAARPGHDGEPGSQPGRTALRVLVVDDNEEAANAMALLLRQAGYLVMIEHDAVRALEEAAHFAPHACLLDIGLPGMDGNELARRLRAESGQATLVALTGYSSRYDRDSAMAAGFDHYFVKPADTVSLFELLASLHSAARMVA